MKVRNMTPEQKKEKYGTAVFVDIANYRYIRDLADRRDTSMKQILDGLINSHRTWASQ